jgi:tyrosyl-tRNA synthetase
VLKGFSHRDGAVTSRPAGFTRATGRALLRVGGMTSSDFLHEAKARGFVFQCTDEAALDQVLRTGVVSGYIGFDCTADSLHVGSMVQIMLLRLLQKHGHRPVPLMGGGTTRIGDPSFREEARQLLTDEQITENMRGIRRNVEPFLRFGDGPSDAIMANNADWLDKLGYIDLLRDVGPHFSVNRMLSFDSVRTRLEREQGLTFLEFNYSILQSYDFRELNRRYGVTLQMGGSDQWGNIVSGVELVRRTDGKQVFGLTAPLITTSSGAKMGKSAKGAVWLSAERVSPYEYWQYWRNTEDADVGRFLRLFTDLPLEEIARLEALGGAEINEAKKVLATEATALNHGREAAEAAAETARRAFEEGEAAADLPTHLVPQAALAAGIPAFRLFTEAGLAASNGDARRLIRGGGARVNDAPVSDEGQVISLEDLRDGAIKLSAGRKQHRLVRSAAK